jgi:type II secretory pathway component GspD/PulD (secretin)
MKTSTRHLTLSALLLALPALRLAAQQPAPATPAAGAQAGAATGAAAPESAPAPSIAAPAGPVIGDADAAAGIATRGRDAAGRDTLSVDFPEEDIKGILRNVAELYDINIIIPDTLQGKTSIKLREVTWSQIFKSILDPVGYTYIQEGNIIKVVSNETLQQEPVVTEIFILKYAKASDILPAVQSLVGSSAGAKIVVEPRTNSLVISDTPSRLTKLSPIITQLDTATAQVAIEAKFIEVTDSDVRNLGINYGVLQGYNIGAAPSGSVSRTRSQTFSDTANGGNGSSGSTTSTTNATQNTASNNAGNVANNGGTATTTSATGTTAALTNAVTAGLTASTTTAMDFLTSLANNGDTNRDFSAVFTASQFSLVLSALNSVSSTKVISNPSLTTLNNKEATFNVGSEVPVPKYSFNAQTGNYVVDGFEYKPIGINLKVTPQVNSAGFITITVNPEVSQQTDSANFNGAQIPVVATRKLSTQISLKSGNTMGIGGMLTSTETNSKSEIPLLGKIPLVGNLFKTKGKNASAVNLLIFITARTVNAEGALIEDTIDPRQTRATGLQPSDLPGFRDGSSPFAPAAPAKK